MQLQYARLQNGQQRQSQRSQVGSLYHGRHRTAAVELRVLQVIYRTRMHLLLYHHRQSVMRLLWQARCAVTYLVRSSMTATAIFCDHPAEETVCPHPLHPAGSRL